METWEWPDSLEALTAAPGFHTVLLETDDVRVLDTRIGPGQTVPVHTHRWPAVLYVLPSGHFVHRDGTGAILVDTRAQGSPPGTGAAVWSPPLPPHTLENVDFSDIHVLSVEVKSP
jgi:hypothetical protein